MLDFEIDWFEAGVYGGSIALVVLLTPFLQKMERTRGKTLWIHIVYAAVASAVLLLVPDTYQNLVFTETGVLVVGTIVPVYSSIVAVCTIDESDDVAWLQFWVASATFTYATEFVDTIAEHSPFVAEHWYELEFWFMLWLMLPFTDGAGVIYDLFTKPVLAPLCQAFKSKMEGWIGLVTMAVNSGYLYLIWFTFMTLPEQARRFVVVGVGTVYPLVASTVAITTESDVTDDAFWLTYWSCFSLLFVMMDYLENFVGGIPGFYSLCLVSVVYLFLPMFRGAEVLFRRVLVPLSGQYEAMLLRDAHLVRVGMERSIPANLQERVFGKAANVFLSKESVLNKKKK